MRRRRLEAKTRVIARDYLSGALGAAETCESLAKYSSWLPDRFSDEDKQFLNKVCSRISALPVGERKDLWHPDFVGARLQELARIEIAIRDDVRLVCDRVLTTMQKHSPILEQG